MSASDFAGLPFTIRVHELVGGWRVNVDAGEDRTAVVTAPSLDTALRMAMPFVVAIADPVPVEKLERLLRLPLAVDGPPELGGRGAA
jgi:hypothetical protein